VKGLLTSSEALENVPSLSALVTETLAT